MKSEKPKCTAIRFSNVNVNYRFSEKKNESVEPHISWHRDIKSQNQDIKIPKPKTDDIGIHGLKHHNIAISRHFFRGQNATTSKFQDQKTATSKF